MQSSPVIADSSVLIAFHEIALLDLLRMLFQEIVVPPTVAREVVPSLGQLPSWMIERQPSHIHEAVRGLDAGEREALSLALEIPPTVVLLDDLPARRIAEKLRLPIVGSVGILLAAKTQGHIETVKPFMDAMRASSLFLGNDVYDGILKAAGEA